MVRFFFGANISGISTNHIPAAETRLVFWDETQTISASGLDSYRLTQNQFLAHKLLNL